MVVLSQPAVQDPLSLIETCKPTKSFTGIPEINLSDPDANTLIVEACQEFGFFKLVNHGVPPQFMTRLEEEGMKYFNLPQVEKEKSSPPNPFGYGSKKIGPNGDVGRIEYLLLNTNPHITCNKTISIFRENQEVFRSALEDYIVSVKSVACEVMEKIADGLGIKPRNAMSKLLKDENSDSCFRLNHYPSACKQELNLSGRNLIGFGEHTDPQIISVLRSNSASGLQICLKDGSWVSVPPDNSSFFIIVGDSLQVMTNGRFRSVKHRVISDTSNPRISMIYFGGPPLTAKIAPLASLMAQGEESLYREFLWSEFKHCVYKSRLADCRLGLFERKNNNTNQIQTL